MQTWDVMRRDDLGNTFHVASHDSRISALAQVLVMESGVRHERTQHERTHWVEGPPGPAVRTNRDLYLVFLHLGQEARAASWSLSAFLRALWKVSAPLSDQTLLEPDAVAAMFAAASTTPPADFDPAWSGRSGPVQNYGTVTPRPAAWVSRPPSPRPARRARGRGRTPRWN
ncbi:hypothetical protein ETD83_38960, partial [Actinomadura soli]